MLLLTFNKLTEITADNDAEHDDVTQSWSALYQSDISHHNSSVQLGCNTEISNPEHTGT